MKTYALLQGLGDAAQAYGDLKKTQFQQQLEQQKADDAERDHQQDLQWLKDQVMDKVARSETTVGPDGVMVVKDYNPFGKVINSHLANPDEIHLHDVQTQSLDLGLKKLKLDNEDTQSNIGYKDSLAKNAGLAGQKLTAELPFAAPAAHAAVQKDQSETYRNLHPEEYRSDAAANKQPPTPQDVVNSVVSNDQELRGLLAGDSDGSIRAGAAAAAAEAIKRAAPTAKDKESIYALARSTFADYVRAHKDDTVGVPPIPVQAP